MAKKQVTAREAYGRAVDLKLKREELVLAGKIINECPDCKGTGKIKGHTCPTCGGERD